MIAMARPHNDNSLTLDNVLSRMVPGKTYPAHVIAAKFHVPTAEIRPVLTRLVESKQVELSKAVPKALGFRRPKGTAVAVDAPVPEKLETSIATPHQHVRLNGQLSGYDSEIARRVALCMLVRGR
ncbi:hypothetical protein BCh11DRAFT_06427 [Burkholderia sp. Ch1-1]|nr:hypothetical protein BCh11DRAFT_06427 [Burkholderia sp. Ch1-1]